MSLGMTDAENARWWKAQRELAQAARDLRESELQGIEARYELENDEGGTARQKAERRAQ